MLLLSRTATIPLTIAFLTLALPGCSAMRSYDGELRQTVDLVAQGNIDQALQLQEQNNTNHDNDLLYFLEKGELLRLKNQYNDSVATWLSADTLVNEWENEAKIRGGAILDNIGAILLNDKTRRYDGHDYEKVMLSTQLALNHLLSGHWDLARTEIKKTHEREAIIAQYRAQEIDAVEKESRQKGVSTSFKELNGYPVATLDSLEVSELKNGYQSAFSHYLAGFVYEALNEPSLAAPGYRQAIELRPNTQLLEDGLAGLDRRNSDLNANTTDVLLVIESGAAPALSSVTIPIPVFYNNLGVIPISFPLLHSDPIRTALPHSVSIDAGIPQNVVGITSLDAMAKRALRDDIPSIMLRGVLRAAVKTASQRALMRSDNGYVKLAGIALNVMNVITESADERSWRTLPSLISIARFTLPVGKHTFSVMNSNGITSSESINIDGSHALVAVRTLGDQTYWSQPIYSGQMPVRVAQPSQKIETLDGDKSTRITPQASLNTQTRKNKTKKKVKK